MYICVYVWIFVCVDTLCMHIYKYTWIWTYLPPDHPVFTSHAVVPCFFILSASMAAYFVGWSIIKAAPKHAENVALGSLTPSSVPATYNKSTLQIWMFHNAPIYNMIKFLNKGVFMNIHVSYIQAIMHTTYSIQETYREARHKDPNTQYLSTCLQYI